jgi:metal-dependent amidase/aminoacylase/carboxypeptidase family protein
MLELVKKYAKMYENELISIRKDLHSHPEIGRQEYRTQKIIIGLLNDLGCFTVKKCADTGVLAIIEGKKAKSDRCIGIRADIDALGIEDLKDVEYKSQNNGICHA